jgi:ribonuclease HI
MKHLKIYTNGAADTANSSYGGWAYVMVEEENWVENSGRVSITNANRLKMTAMLQALESVIGRSSKPDEVILYSDSEYCIECFSGGRRVAHRHRHAELINPCLDIVLALQQARTTVRFKWLEKRIRDPFIGSALSIAKAELKGNEPESHNLWAFLA